MGECGFCNLNVVAVRAEPGFGSEIVTQLLFGDRFTVLEPRGIFARIRTAYEGYEGWIDGRQSLPVAPEVWDGLESGPEAVSVDAFAVARCGDEEVLVVRGSSLPSYADGRFAVGGREYSFLGSVVRPDGTASPEQVVAYARLYLNTPYLWGGRSPCGIDCSGLVQLAYKMIGVRLPRDSGQQLAQGEEVPSIAAARAGDLVFAESSAGGHVGMALGDGRLIHASARVRLDLLTGDAIVDAETGQRTHRIVGVRRHL